MINPEEMSPGMNHVMIDLETLGTSPSATITAIGAVLFNPYSGTTTGRTFYRRCDWDQGRDIDPATVRWWLTQSDEARAEISAAGEPLAIVLKMLDYWLSEIINPIVWGNGASFDITILTHAYNNVTPWHYADVRDVRTVVELAAQLGIERPKMDEAQAHNALNDARHQAEYVSMMVRALIAK